ncbi:Hypothetical protein PHPALM_11382 [Phytophthora palmivora]|uniref:Uncharacterized protein n=1 Tax=Phytophthora palmivora TaxID=4796 RepID=A0A2P4Y2E9_9STRA|nr:Hypothetical protein PHPALM_11382 [Phytophthora palmivora]
MVLYVRREVRRWEEVNPGKVTPPSVVYEWPTPKPDANSYFAAAYATGDYFKWCLSLVNQDEAWISEFHVARWGVGTAQDLMATTIPQNIMTARECVAILQTLFFEAGFEFLNLIPGWSTTCASRIPESLVRSVMEEVQNFIAVELVEWRLVTAGVSFKLNSEDHAAPSVQEQVPRLEYHKEDGDGDLLMTDYDADLLGRQFVLRFRVTGLRISRSPRGSSDSEPQSKRSQHGPPRPLVPSTPSALSTPSLSTLPAYKSSTGTSIQNSTPLNSMSNGGESLEMEAKDAVPDLVPSVIDISRASDECTASGSQTSYGSSSSSSMRSLGQQVGALALVAQSASGFTAAGDLGFQVTRTVIPHSHVAVEQEDVEMESSVRSDPEIATRKTGLPWISAATAEPKLRVSSPSSGFDCARNVAGDERSQHQSSKSEVHSRRSARSRKSATSSRSSASRQLGSASSVSSRSGPAQIELNVLRQQQEWQARMEQEQREFLARERLDALERERFREQRDLDARRHIQELTDRLVHAEVVRRDAGRRMQDVEARQTQGPTETQGVTQSVTEAVRLERERLDATERWQQREAEADAERARWASEVHASWKEQMSTMEQKIQELEAEKERERETSLNIQRFHAGQVRDLRTTLAQVQGRRATVTPNLATNVSSDENPGVNLTAASATQAGTTLLTFRSYINSNTLGEFDTKASLRERVHWWERFANMAAQGGWAMEVVNISNKDVWIDNRTPVARIVEYGFFPRAGRFVRPGSFAYREWQTLILENVQPREGRIRAERLAALGPARGVVCDLDVGDAKPVAQRPRSIAPHLWTKVYELRKKLLENGLIETSISPWASPIVIVLKKNGVDIRILDMASGFWAIKMTERAKLISAFVCPYGHYQWVRMPFGLKNAPLIYLAVLNNCLLGLNSGEPRFSGESVPRLSVLTDEMTVFQRNIPAPSHMGPVLGRCSHIDDIAHGAPTWEQLCQDLNALLFRLRYWNISVSLPKSEFGKLSIPFMGSLNHYNKFIEDLPVIAAVLYELTEEQMKSRRDLSRVQEAFEVLKHKIVSTPLLRHPDRSRPCGCILWRLPGWEILDAQGFILGNVTVNDAEYHGLLKGLALAIERGVKDIVVVGDSRIAIQQAQGLINCNQPNLQKKLAEYEALKTKFKSVRLVHVKREFNQAADYLTSKTLALGESWKVEDADERTHLQLVSKIHEKLVKPLPGVGIQKDDPQGAETLSAPGPECAPLPAAAKVFAVITRAQIQESEIQGETMGPLKYQAERWRRIKVHQDTDSHLLQLKDFLRGNTGKLSHAQAWKLAKIADDFVLDSREVLYRLSRSTRDRPRDMIDELRLVVPRALQPDILHYAHEDFQGGHQGIARTHEKLHSEFY